MEKHAGLKNLLVADQHRVGVMHKSKNTEDKVNVPIITKNGTPQWKWAK